MHGSQVCYPFSETRKVPGAASRFRTIQAYPKDIKPLPVHPEPAVRWHGGFGRGAHARHGATPGHHAGRRRCGRLAASRTSTTAVTDDSVAGPRRLTRPDA